MNLLSFTAAPHRACRSWRGLAAGDACETCRPCAGEGTGAYGNGPAAHRMHRTGWRSAERCQRPRPARHKATRPACGWLRGAQGGAVHMALAGIHAPAWKFSALFLRGVSIFRKQPGFPAGHAGLSLSFFRKQSVRLHLAAGGTLLLVYPGISRRTALISKAAAGSGRTTPKTRNSAPPRNGRQTCITPTAHRRSTISTTLVISNQRRTKQAQQPQSAIQTAERIIQYTILRLSLHSVAFLSLPQ